MARVRTYVTGSHNLKVGLAAAYQVIHFGQRSGDNNLSYRSSAELPSS